MKKLFLALLVVPFLAGCWWNKKADVIETTAASTHEESNLEKFEHLMGEAEEDDEYLDRPVNGEIQDK